MQRIYSLLACLTLLEACRSTVNTSASLGVQESEPVAIKLMPLALGDGYACVLDKKSQGRCLGLVPSINQKGAPVWQTLRAAGSTPVLRNLVSQSTVTCGIGVKPPSLENRILCWQPKTTQYPSSAETDTMILSGKVEGKLRSLALQKDQICALLMDGQVACGELSDSNTLKISLVKGLRSIHTLRSGAGFSCGIRGDTGVIFCWGDNRQGQLGIGEKLSEESEAVPIAGFSGTAKFIDAGSQHACAINDSGEVFCWGLNIHQQLGADNHEKKKDPIPQIVRGLPAQAEALALGEKHSCAQLTDGTVWCWGATDFPGAEMRRGLIPMKVNLPAASTHITASVDRSCSLLSTGATFCWGSEPKLFSLPH